MIITNKMGLPEPFVNMAKADEYKLADKEYRVTSLLKGVRETILERRHHDEIERDCADMVWMLWGTAVHGVLEHQQETDTQLKEERLKVELDGYTISGKFDLYDDSTKTVQDYKTASVWKAMFGDFSDWRRQTLIYCWLLRQTGFDAQNGRITAFLKDHSKRDAKIKAGYPQLPVYVVDFHFTEEDFAECETWLRERIKGIKQAEQLSDDMLPVCSPEERFNSGDKFAVMKKGRKTALRVLDSHEEAVAWLVENGGDSIECRPGEDKKCADYCACKEFCSYYKAKMEARA